ncbi:MAG: 4-hydroxy-tetrahydrodipicolinate synthase [Dehalococcoidia bacterium]
MERFAGIMPPIPTPFNADYSLNTDALRSLVEFLVVEGVHAIIPLGSTGEFARQSIEERKRVLEVCLDQARGRIPVIAGTAAPGTREVIELSRHAERAGARGLQVVAPFYGKPSEDELFEHYRWVAESVGIPILIYNNPGTSGIDMSPPFLARLSEIPNITGVKEATGDPKRVRQILKLAPDGFDVYAGTDDYFFESFLFGARGWVSGSANLVPRRCVELYELAVVKEDFKAAKVAYADIADLCDMMETEAFVQNIKAGLEILGLEAGPPRPPFLPAGPEVRDQIKALLDKLGAGPIPSVTSRAAPVAPTG